MLLRLDLFVTHFFFGMQFGSRLSSVFPLYRQQGAQETSFNYMFLSVVITTIL